MVLLNDALTVIQVLLVDINTGDVETFAFDQVMKIFHHDAVADAYVQDGGVFGHVIQAVLIAVVGDPVDKKLVKIIFFRSQNGIGRYCA